MAINAIQTLFFSIVLNVLLLFHNYLPFEKGVALHLNKLESPSPRDTLYQNWPSGYGEEDANFTSVK